MPRTSAQLKLENVLLLAKQWEERRAIRKAEERLSDFIKLAWPVIEPGTIYVHGRHIDAIAEHLEAVRKRQIRKLLINLPPRFMKSSLVAVLFPAWVWITQPEEKFLFTSYDLKLSYRDSRKCRMLIKSPWYQKNWADRYSIVKDQDEKRRFDNDKMGYRVSTSTDAGTTGEGASCIVADDPNNIREMTSQAYIESVFEYHDQVLATRLNDARTGVRIIIQQRCSEQDLTGHVLERESGWDHLVLPCEYEGPGKVTSIGWKDWRTEPGELLWPERFPRAEIDEIKRTLGPMGVAGQLQQRPAPAEGSTYLREWWNYYNPEGVATDKPVKIETSAGKYVEKTPVPIPVAFEQVVQGWDMAFKDNRDNDLVAGHAWGRVGSNVYLLARKTGRWDFPKTQREVRGMHAEFPCPEKMIENKANGPAIIQSLKNEIPGLIESPIDGGLKALANSLTGYVEAGNVYLPNPDLFPWVHELIEQYAMFPNGKHDDDVAAASHALRRLFDSAANAGVPEFRVMPRLGEVENACHVRPDAEIAAELEPQWRRWIAIAPGKIGAAVWICETPSKSLRVYREFEMDGIDAHEAGRKIAELSMSDITAFMKLMNNQAKWNIDFLMEKDSFRPVEPVGSFAELLEDGILSYESNSESWLERQETKAKMKLAKFASEMVQIEDGSIERLRDLLRFSPPDFKPLPYDRKKAIQLSDKDVYEYNQYISAVEGKVFGEWPKIKIAASCKGVIRALGGFRRNDDIADNFLRALLIGVSAPDSVMMRAEVPKERAYPFVLPRNAHPRRRFGSVA
jgi:predicted phage terminase large subunit-like protein